MSQPGGKKGAGKAPVKKSSDDLVSERGTPAALKNDIEPTKDETSSNGDKKEASKEEAGTPKPQSAGASTRDGAQRVLTQALKAEWTAIEPVMKQLEKAIAAAGDEANTAPLAGVMDPVIFFKQKFSIYFFFFLSILPASHDNEFNIFSLFNVYSLWVVNIIKTRTFVATKIIKE